MKRINFLFLGMLSAFFIPVSAFADDVYITPNGIGDLTIGAPVSSIPSEMPGVYNKVELVSEEYSDEGGFEDETECYVATMKGKTVLKIYPYEDKVYSIEVYSKDLTTKNGLSLKSTPSDLFLNGCSVISRNDGGEDILSDGVLFYGIPETDEGRKKSEEAYLGGNVTFYVKDFEPKGKADYIIIADYFAELSGKLEYNDPVGAENYSSLSRDDVLGIIVGILIVLAILAMIAHMIYVNYFSKPYPEELLEMKGTPENNAYVLSAMDNLYDNVFTPYCDPNEKPGPDTLNFPIGKKAAYETKAVLDDIYANHLPVDDEAADKLRKVSIITNEVFRRAFSGSKLYIVLALVVGIGASILNETAVSMLYFILSSVMYYYSCRTPNYVIMKNELKALKRGHVSKGFMNGVLAGIFGMAAASPVYVEITKNAHTGEIIDKKEDHTPTLLALAFSIILFIILAYMMLFVSIFNYLRNYVLRK